MRIEKRGKLSLGFIDQFEVLERVGEVAYMFVLPGSLLGIHLVFYVSVLRKYNKIQPHVLNFSTVQLDETLAYKEEPMDILER